MTTDHTGRVGTGAHRPDAEPVTERICDGRGATGYVRIDIVPARARTAVHRDGT